MNKISSYAVLQETIQILEVEREIEGRILKEQFHQTYEHFKPANLLRNTLLQVTSTPYLIDNIIGSAVGLATGYLSKKIVVGASGNIIRKFLGIMVQLGVTSSVAQNPDTIRSFGQFIYQRFLRKKRE
jgi:hypothetical protein